MARQLPAAVNTIISSISCDPVELYDLYLDDFNPDVVSHRFVNHITDLTFGSNTYIAIGLQRSAIENSADLSIDNLAGQLDDVERTFVQSVMNLDFNNKRVVIKKAFLSLLNSPTNYIIIFDGRMGAPTFEGGTFKISVYSYLNILNLTVPRRVFSPLCGYRLGDTWCSVDLTAPSNCVTAVAEAGTGIYTIVSSSLVRSEIPTGVATQDNYWVIGEVKVLSGAAAGLVRPVAYSGVDSFGSGYLTVRIPFPTSIAAGDTFVVRRGCDKTYTSCMSKFNNFLNFGGFHTIPEMPLI